MANRITEDLNKINVGNFYLFSYGSNGLDQLADRLGVNRSNLEAYPAKLEGWSRGFFSYSDNREGSVATIFKNPGNAVFGIAVRLEKLPNGVNSVDFDGLSKLRSLHHIILTCSNGFCRSSDKSFA